MDDLWDAADRSGRIECRFNCPHCAKGAGDRTLSLNTRKRVGYCHRCGFKMTGDAMPEHFAQRYLDDLERERYRRTFRFEKIRDACKPISRDDAACLYLEHRLGLGLATLPRLGFAHAVRYYTGLARHRTTPAMVGALQDAGGRVTGWHVTHLSADGAKAFGSDSRRYAKLHPLSGSAIRLYPAGDALVVAEGIETALALQLVTADPVWATTSAALLKAFEPPPGIERLLIASDNDANGVGQRAAWALHDRLHRKMDVSVVIPDRENSDWLDSLVNA